ncbi:8399_t:CDS:2, partial [Funneliformis mosseae]
TLCNRGLNKLQNFPPPIFQITKLPELIRQLEIKYRKLIAKMALNNDPENVSKDLETSLTQVLQTNERRRIKDSGQSKEKANEENQLLISDLLNELDRKDLDDLRKLLAGRKPKDILAELYVQSFDIRNLNIDLVKKKDELSKLNFQLKYLEEIVEEREEEIKAFKEEKSKNNKFTNIT